MNKITIQDILDYKKSRKPFATLTSYDYSSAKIVDSTGIPLILVGDSAAMVMLGYENTLPITMDEMLVFVKAVSRGSTNALVVADMPFMSYQSSVEQALVNAGLFVKEGNANAVKLEGGKRVIPQINAMVQSGIPVMGHLGLTPQSFHQLSGYSIQGKTPGDAQKIIDDAKAVEEAGGFAVVLECVPESTAEEIKKTLTIPKLGIL